MLENLNNLCDLVCHLSKCYSTPGYFGKSLSWTFTLSYDRFAANLESLLRWNKSALQPFNAERIAVQEVKVFRFFFPNCVSLRRYVVSDFDRN